MHPSGTAQSSVPCCAPQTALLSAIAVLLFTLIIVLLSHNASPEFALHHLASAGLVPGPAHVGNLSSPAPGSADPPAPPATNPAALPPCGSPDHALVLVGAIRGMTRCLPALLEALRPTRCGVDIFALLSRSSAAADKAEDDAAIALVAGLGPVVLQVADAPLANVTVGAPVTKLMLPPELAALVPSFPYPLVVGPTNHPVSVVRQFYDWTRAADAIELAEVARGRPYVGIFKTRPDACLCAPYTRVDMDRALAGVAGGASAGGASAHNASSPAAPLRVDPTSDYAPSEWDALEQRDYVPPLLGDVAPCVPAVEAMGEPRPPSVCVRGYPLPRGTVVHRFFMSAWDQHTGFNDMLVFGRTREVLRLLRAPLRHIEELCATGPPSFRVRFHPETLVKAALLLDVRNEAARGAGEGAAAPPFHAVRLTMAHALKVCILRLANDTCTGSDACVWKWGRRE